jgi:hypothetical protein
MTLPNSPALSRRNSFTKKDNELFPSILSALNTSEDNIDNTIPSSEASHLDKEK